MSNNWSRAIEALAAAEDFRGILFRIAAKHPKAVVDACSQSPAKEEPFIAACRALLHADQKIAAIKLWRNQTGVGLKEAKDAVEALL